MFYGAAPNMIGNLSMELVDVVDTYPDGYEFGDSLWTTAEC